MEVTRPKLPEAGDYIAVLGSAIAPIAALAWGMGSGNPYGYYVFLRVVVCFCAVVFAAICSGYKREGLWLLFAAICVLYNPFIPFHLSRGLWQFINIATIVVFTYGLIVWFLEVRRSRNAA